RERPRAAARVRRGPVAGGDAGGRRALDGDPGLRARSGDRYLERALRPVPGRNRIGGADTMTLAYDLLAEKLADRGDDVGRVEAALRAQVVETPTWAYANSGTRFAVF